MPPGEFGRHEDARSALECGGLTPPSLYAHRSASREVPQRVEESAGAADKLASRGDPKAASSRRTPRCLRHSVFQSRRGGIYE